ncbi:hypothetical protein BS50DRAFT_576327 [Corynespora cassiicola Philippines]|uniref:NADH-ubiquinone reductase complex 1 MLRQ subunit n=1 Tax=Corynespora cassiicola Philippines TaxID=1448308 RepID=A0A2T2NE35_CORCC|nr:hypothetical protein BS50DRAFT_576327 [Corynespora cassiicola Philippines]
MFRSTRVLAMQPTRAAFMRQTPQAFFKQTGFRMTPVPKEEHGAHTISQRLRQLKKIPAELIPLGVVLAVAVGAAIFSLGNKLVKDKTLRLKRQAGNS